MVRARKHLAHGPVVVMLALALGLSLAPVRTRASEPQPSEAQAYEVIDSAGNTLFARNENQQMDPASITKVMTAMVALDSGKRLDDVCTLSEISYQSDAQIAGIKTGDTLTLRQLLMVMLIFSANDAADNVALAVSSSKDAFVNAMNDKAREIGMWDSVFLDPTGLSASNVSTARDLALLVARSARYPEIRRFSVASQLQVRTAYGTRVFHTTNPLVGNQQWGLTVQKTGFINEAGNCVVMQARVNGRQMIIVLLDSQGRYSRVADANRIRRFLEG